MPSLLLVVATLLGAIVLAALLGSHARGGRARALLQRIPGPKALLPWVGQGLALRSPARRHRLLREWSEQYGGVFKITLWGAPAVVVSDPRAVRSVLGQGRDDLPKHRRTYRSLDQMVHSEDIPSLATGPSDAYWRAARKCLLHSFGPAQLSHVLAVARSKAAATAGVLGALGPGVVVDMADVAGRYSLDVLMLGQLGYSVKAVESPGEVLLLRLVREASEEWALRRGNPLRWLAPWISDAAAAGGHRLKILAGFCAALWADLAGRPAVEDGDMSLVAQLRRLRDPMTAEAVDPEVLTAEVGGLLLQGHETVAAALCWALGCLAGSPAAQDRLLAELRREGVADSPGRLGPDTLPRLTYLDAVVREALRLHPTGPMAATTVRCPGADVPAGFLTLPAGVPVIVDTYSMHRSPRLWRDPGRFDPDRWAAAAAGSLGGSGGSGSGGYDGFGTVERLEGEGGEEGAPGGQASSSGVGVGQGRGPGGGAEQEEGAEGEAPLCSPEAFMPFGYGARSCVGQRMALVEVKVALAVLVGRFRFEPATDDPAVYADTSGLVLWPAQGMPLQVTPRKGVGAAGGAGGPSRPAA